MYKDIIARRDNVKDTVNKLGRRNNLYLDRTDSITAIATNTVSTFASENTNPKIRSIGEESVAIPQGKNKDPSITENNINLSMEENSIIPSPRPEYSICIPSWTIVSSRCVDGLSNGILAFSARSVMKKDDAARISMGVNAASPRSINAGGMLFTSVPTFAIPANAIIERSNAGSMRTDIMVSLLLPIPPKDEPPSNPPSTIMKRYRVNMYTIAIRSA